ncbi:MAG: DUF222 domain-containing protein [Acidimicrobiia bacterium]|nr:DUF222 domain-containing protein [Acidimicrobiia bacterium]
MTTILIPHSDLATTPTERLEAEATTLAGHLAAAMCRFLDVVAELARRHAWEAWETRSMAHWVSWKCGIGTRAAQEHVRIALALADLPETHAAFAQGSLSYSKVRALTRFITPGNETDTVELAHHTTAHQLERIARAHVAACRAADPDRTRAAMDAAHVSMHTNEDDTITITARLPTDLARRTLQAIDHAAKALPPDPGAEPNTKRVHGLATIVDTYLEPDPNRSAVEVVVHVDVETLSEDTPGQATIDGHPIATETVRRLACDAGIRLCLDRADTLLDLGRKSRFPNPALRRAIEHRDHHTCRFPGCTQRTRLRAHHARNWAHGGPTDRDNLVMLCPTHHRTVHEGGWHVEPDGTGGFTFINPGGQAIPNIDPPTTTTPDAAVTGNDRAGVTITPDTIASLWAGEPLDLDWTMTAILCAHPATPRPHNESDDTNGKRSAERSGAA